jgi:hypothetical protein
MDFQKVDLFKPIMSIHPAPAPIALKIAVMPEALFTQGGSLTHKPQPELFVRISCLPEELQMRVKSALDMLVAAR